MDTSYYRFVILSIFLSSLVPVALYFLPGEKSGAIASEQKTVYHFEQVPGPIQPIPRKMDIDTWWVSLGKALFISPILSKDNTIPCSSCHLLDFGGDDGFPISIGINNAKGQRNSPTVFNSSLSFRQFWDGRAGTLSDQIAGPVHNPVELGSSWAEIIEKLKADQYFNKSFRALDPKGVTRENIVKAITVFEESLITPDSPIDR